MSDRGALTRLKLDEAKFFLDHLRPNFKKERKFDFYLSAYISAARSVTWVMRREYGRVPGWKEWFKALEPTREEMALLKGTNRVRIRTTKRGPLQTMSRVQIEGVSVPENHKAALARVTANSPNRQIKCHVGGKKGNYYVEVDLEGSLVRFPVANVIVERKLEEFPGTEVLSVCDAYYAALEAVVQKCHARFDA